MCYRAIVHRRDDDWRSEAFIMMEFTVLRTP